MKQKYNITEAETSFQSYMSETRQLINSELLNLVSSLSEVKLHPQIEYALLSKGKRLRPNVMKKFGGLLTCRAPSS